MDIIKESLIIVGSIFGVLTFYREIYKWIGFFMKSRTYPTTTIKREYAVLIPARNEEKVIGNLIDSIKLQNYDQSKITIFVVADNCTDQTAIVAKTHGAICYERFDDQKKRKGYALDYLVNRIKKDYDINTFDGFFVFDADNVLELDFIEEMNKAFVQTNSIVTSYRNTKNFDTNWISASYGIHFYRRSMAYHRPRSILGIGTHLSGTGFLMPTSVISDGFHFHELTEDTEMTMVTSANGMKIAYCESAIHYDEQPTSLKVALTQRLRWTKGRLNVFKKTWRNTIKGIFKSNGFTNYDLFFYLFPYSLVELGFQICLMVGGVITALLLGGSLNIGGFFIAVLLYYLAKYVSNLFYNTLAVIREKKNISCPFYKTVFFLIVSPWFQLISIYLMVVSLFKNVQWHPIIHSDSKSIDEIKQDKKTIQILNTKSVFWKVMETFGIVIGLLGLILFTYINQVIEISFMNRITYFVIPSMAITLIVFFSSYVFNKKTGDERQNKKAKMSSKE